MSESVKQIEFAKLRKVTKGRVSQWKEAGLLVFDEKGLVLVDASNAKLDGTLDMQKRAAQAGLVDVPNSHSREVPVPPAADQPSTPTDPAIARDKDVFREFNLARMSKEKELAIQARLDREEREGVLVQSSVVKAAASQLAMLIAAGLDMLPARIGALVANEADPDKREQLVEDECFRLREEFSRRAEELQLQPAPAIPVDA